MWGLSRHAYLTESVEPAARGRSIAAFGGAKRIGMLVGPALGGVVAATLGFAAAFVAFGSWPALAFGLCAALPGARSAAETAAAQAPRAPRRVAAGAGAAARPAARQRDAGFSVGADDPLGPPHRAAALRLVVLGLDVQAIGWVLSIAAAFDVALFPLAGVIMDRWGRKYAIVPCFVIQAIGMAAGAARRRLRRAWPWPAR
jgi:MFS family permease